MMVALPMIAWKAANESVPVTRPPATLQSIDEEEWEMNIYSMW